MFTALSEYCIFGSFYTKTNKQTSLFATVHIREEINRILTNPMAVIKVNLCPFSILKRKRQLTLKRFFGKFLNIFENPLHLWPFF